MAEAPTYPLCFLHVPKSAGSSVRSAIVAAFPAGALAPKSFDASMFCDFDAFELLDPALRSSIVVTDDEIASLAAYRVVSGHFSLPTLERVAPPHAIATVLREPRARLLSLYAYVRVTPGVSDPWAPYRIPGPEAGTLDDFLSEPRAAQVVCSHSSRMLLAGDPRFPPAGFADPSDAEAIAADALARLDRLGFVGVMELGDAAWKGMSEHFGVELSQRSANVTGEKGVATGVIGKGLRVTAGTLDLIEARTASERLVYEHVAAERLGSREAARRMADAAFAAQLVRVGDLMGSAAAEREALRAAADQKDALEAELRSTRASLERSRGVMRDLQSSASWRLTAPLRTAKRAVRKRKSA